MRARVLAAVILGAVAAGTAACGDEGSSAGATSTVDLSVSVSDGGGKTATGTLTCDGDARGSGFLADGVAVHCRAARRLGRLLATKPRLDRVCTQVYGGTQTARVRGTIAGRAVARDFSRRDGCEIADWTRAAALLDPSGIRAGAAP